VLLGRSAGFLDATLDGRNQKGLAKFLQALLTNLVAGARNHLDLEFAWAAA
jgi:hypothetical protein